MVAVKCVAQARSRGSTATTELFALARGRRAERGEPLGFHFYEGPRDERQETKSRRQYVVTGVLSQSRSFFCFVLFLFCPREAHKCQKLAPAWLRYGAEIV